MNRNALKHHWDRVLALAAALVGLVLLVIGWAEVSGTAVVAEQIPYLASMGVGGLIAFGVATTLWISADLRDEWAKLDEMHRAFTGAESSSPSPTVVAESSASAAPTTGRHGAALEASLPR